MPTPYRIVLVAAPSRKEAQKVAMALLEEKLAACVNVIPKVESLYWWKGKIETTEEHLLLVKTRASLMINVLQVVRENHSHEIPEIISLPIMDGNKPYLDWLGANTNLVTPMQDIPREELEEKQ